MPSGQEKRTLINRDGLHCRFCNMPVIDAAMREAIRSLYPNALRWGRRDSERHSAFQCMWLQYDHIVPHSRGGDNSLDNMLITCAACNFGKEEWTLEELGLIDPRTRPPYTSLWDG